MKNYFKLAFVSFIILFFSNKAFSDTTYFIDFSKVLNQSKAGKQAQNILKKRLEDSVSNFNKEEKNLRSGNIKSFDTNYFNFSLVKDLPLEDGVATLTEFTVRIIISAIKKADHYKENIILCGGGRKNNFLVDKLKEESDRIKLIDDYGIDGDFVESQAFAYLAIRSYLKLPISFPETTGVIRPITGGKIFKN